MSIFGTIMHKIFTAAGAALAPANDPALTAIPASTTAQAAPDAGTLAVPAPEVTSTGTPAPTAPVDVEAVLTQMAATKGGGGNWQSSIVDLLKLLDMESSLAARSQLAAELNVHAGPDGTAEENIALHKAVMQKLAENGGKVPDSMK